MAKPIPENKEILIPDELVMNQIYHIRGEKVMLDSDLASLYKVETKVLNQAVSRNIDRFPEDFMFQLSAEEWGILKSQIVTSSWGGRRKTPNVFTEHGVLMLSSVLKSKLAIQVNIRIMRIFNQIRTALTDNTELRLEISKIKHSIEKINKKQEGQDKSVELIFEFIDRLQDKLETSAPSERKSIGYKIKGK